MNPEVAAVSLFCSVVAIYIWNYTYWTRRKIRQGFQFPLFGDNFRHFFGICAFQDVLQAVYDKFPDTRYTGFYQYVQPGLMLRDPALIKTICMNRIENFTDRTPFMSETDDVLWNKTLFALRGQQWKQMRNTLAHAFTGNKMKQMFPVIVDISQKFTNTLKERDGDILEIEFKDLSQRFTNDIIANVAFGLAVDSLKDPENEFFVHGKATTDSKDYLRNLKMKLTLMWPSLGMILKTNVFTKEISNFFRNVIQNTMEHRKQNFEERKDVIQLLMKVHNEPQEAAAGDGADGPPLKLDADDIISQALIFFLGGFETVSSSMCFMAYELAANEHIQTRLLKEIDDYKRKNPISKYEHVLQMLYLDMVLAEVLRKWPPILNLDRICTRQYDISPVLPSEQKITIEKDDLIWVPVWCIHHDPKYWPEPEKFDPERFSKENKSTSQEGKYIPFGLGGRSCIGTRFAILMIKVFFFELLQRFRIVPIPKSHIPFVPAKHTFNLASKYDFWFGLEKRTDAEVVDDKTSEQDESEVDEEDKDENLDEQKNNDKNIFDKKDTEKKDDKIIGDRDEIFKDNEDVDKKGKTRSATLENKIIAEREEILVINKDRNELRKRGG